MQSHEPRAPDSPGASLPGVPEQAEPWTVPATILARYGELPPSARRVLEDPALFGRLCIHCIHYKNVSFEKRRVFCRSCMTVLSGLPEYACACGAPLYLDDAAKPARVCKRCHAAESGRRPRGLFEKQAAGVGQKKARRACQLVRRTGEDEKRRKAGGGHRGVLVVANL